MTTLIGSNATAPIKNDVANFLSVILLYQVSNKPKKAEGKKMIQKGNLKRNYKRLYGNMSNILIKRG